MTQQVLLVARQGRATAVVKDRRIVRRLCSVIHQLLSTENSLILADHPVAVIHPGVASFHSLLGRITHLFTGVSVGIEEEDPFFQRPYVANGNYEPILPVSYHIFAAGMGGANYRKSASHGLW